ncbi:hypothetical protein EJ05DRAFT_498738 [Pseudovirgaria hyperparasitica]|uniref:SPX domain-containing protein n=1 Tax=Pseudovirgaria hyperparasitica TaxID=470096 RepID=A0A6A6WCF1_9PEZI|nr:uncharacterized protein EJ05DRAFT_498738 [Pseudovirgaria hyperparasitica]KAF2759526.1 hypothetical protein EJ05DRAFT_498738 [Pseudovirgaria hyperparasitica]
MSNLSFQLPDNVDYDEIKRVIKENTTPGHGKAVSIPGHGDPVERRFEDELIELFEQEQRRVDLFVRTKSGEIDRRLVHLGQQISRLAGREKSLSRARIPARRLERYAKLEDDVLKVGQELNGLSRYLNAQRTAFRKLLKKYRKWTGNDTLHTTVKDLVMDQPGSCWKLDLSPMFDRYTELLQFIRSAFEPSATASLASRFTSGRETIPANTLQAIASIQNAVDAHSELDFDLSLATTPFGHRGGKAIYWVNPESAIELQVLLSRHMRLLVPQAKLRSSPFASELSSPIDSPTRRQSIPGAEGEDKGDHVGTLILDNERRYAEQEIGKTIEDNEGVPGRTPAKALGQVCWSSAGEAAMAVGLNSGHETDATVTMPAKTKRKHLHDLLDVSRPFSRHASSAMLRDYYLDDDTTDNDAATSVRDWLSHHSEVTPIAAHCAKRTRFLGLTNNSSRAVWATLDQDVHFKRTEIADVCEAEWSRNMRQNSARFPHCVLEVRHEGFESAELVNILDNSHLTERVRGFSLETHAVWECCQPKSMPPPFWMSIVNNAISNVPEEERQRRPRRLASLTTGGAAAADMASISASSTTATDGDLTNVSTPRTSRGGNTSNTSAPDQLETPTLSAFRKKRRRNLPLRKDSFTEQSEIDGLERPGGYWNEYDHPEEGSADDDAYVIYLDPNASNFPGEEYLRAALARVTAWLGGGVGGSSSAQAGEDVESQQRRLLLSSPTRSDDVDDFESSDDERPLMDGEVSSRRRSNGYYHHYGTWTSNDGHAVATTTGGPKSIYQGLFKAFTSSNDAAATTAPHSRRLGNHAEPFMSVEARYREREQHKYRLYVTSLGAAATIVAILVFLATTSRHKYRGEVDTVLVVGILANLAFAFGGVGYMMSRQDVLPWWHRGLVAAVFVGVCVVDGMLLIWPFTAVP